MSVFTELSASVLPSIYDVMADEVWYTPPASASAQRSAVIIRDAQRQNVDTALVELYERATFSVADGGVVRGALVELGAERWRIAEIESDDGVEIAVALVRV